MVFIKMHRYKQNYTLLGYTVTLTRSSYIQEASMYLLLIYVNYKSYLAHMCSGMYFQIGTAVHAEYKFQN